MAAKKAGNNHHRGGPLEPLAVDVEEVTRLLSLSRAQVYRFLNAGELITVRVGRKRLVSMKSVHDFIDRHVEDATS